MLGAQAFGTGGIYQTELSNMVPRKHTRRRALYMKRGKKVLPSTENLEDEIRKEASFWRQVLRRLFDIIITLAKSSLALRGHREDLSERGNHGNFLSIVQLVARNYLVY